MSHTRKKIWGQRTILLRQPNSGKRQVRLKIKCSLLPVSGLDGAWGLNVRLRWGEGLIGIEDQRQDSVRIQRPRFPIICAVGDELISAWSAVGFQRQIERFEIQSGEVLDVVARQAKAGHFIPI
mgnify:CR=1 FL=1